MTQDIEFRREAVGVRGVFVGITRLGIMTTADDGSWFGLLDYYPKNETFQAANIGEARKRVAAILDRWATTN